ATQIRRMSNTYGVRNSFSRLYLGSCFSMLGSSRDVEISERQWHVERGSEISTSLSESSIERQEARDQTRDRRLANRLTARHSLASRGPGGGTKGACLDDEVPTRPRRRCCKWGCLSRAGYA